MKSFHESINIQTVMITIEPYSDTLKNQIITLILSIQTEEFGFSITSEQQPDLHNIGEYYQTQSGNFWVATLANNVIGTISLLDIGNKQAALRKMFVHSDYRGSKYGTAKKLLSQLVTWATSEAPPA
jgi:GNAT superfamily N-acetyltransferase